LAALEPRPTSGDCWEREVLPWEAVVWENGKPFTVVRFSAVPPREAATMLDDVVDASFPEAKLSDSEDEGDAERFGDEALEALE
jgi:hypothetical protein